MGDQGATLVEEQEIRRSAGSDGEVPRQAKPGSPVHGSEAMRLAWESVLGEPSGGLLAPALTEGLNRHARRQDLGARAMLRASAELAEDVVLLVHGELAIGTATQVDGNGVPSFVVERSLSAPAWVDLSSTWRGGCHSHDLQATSDVVLLRLPREAVLRLMAEHPALVARLLRAMAEQVGQWQAVARDLLHKDAEARFATWLLSRVGDLPADASEAAVTFAERKRDIAAQLGITPETLSRLQRGLSRKGLIEVMGYSVRIVDLQRLRELAG